MVEHETIDDLFDQETEEHVLSELKDDGDDPQLPEELSEGEAAEILRTRISQRRTYTQSMRQKKQAELLRGYGKPFESCRAFLSQPFGPGRYQITVGELKKPTRCNLCHEKGHWS